MQHLDNNNMDDLFQRAAENYPLKNEKGNWESVAKRIATKDGPKEGAVSSRSKNNKKLLLLLVFLLMIATGWFMLHLFNPGTSPRNIAGKISNKSDASSHSYKTKDNNADVPAGKQNLVPLPSKKNIKNRKSMLQFQVSSSTTILAGMPGASVDSDISNERPGEIKAGNNSIVQKPRNTNIETFQEKSKEEISENLKNDSGKTPNQPKEVNEEIKKQEKNNQPEIIKNSPGQKSPYQKKKGFYVGVITGLDFSKVASGSFNNTGFDAGLLLGYRINQALSFETGVMWNKKNYVSDGKNFNIDKVRSTMPSGMVINTLEGNSSLIEIPIKARYDFVRKTKTDLFVSGGVSSYIITKEKNMYSVTVNGTPEKVLGIYEKNICGLPSVANVSVGYEHKVSEAFDIRIEPFLKVPLRGIGVGDLHVTSAGLQIGLTGRLK
jgi:Outer membrane protein beta-barrel domain